MISDLSVQQLRDVSEGRCEAGEASYSEPRLATGTLANDALR